MSGADPLRDDCRALEPGAVEPSMEEILASIRRILADGQGPWTGSQAADAGREATEPGAQGPELPAPSRTRSRTTERRDGAALVSAATQASVAAAFQTLVASRFVRNTDFVADLTREMIRPLLEAWLDAHLPAIVERSVAAEIARIARGE